MITQKLRSSPSLFIVRLLAILFYPAARSRGRRIVERTANDASGSTSFTTGLQWIGGVAPTAGNNYFDNGFQLRSPGDSLNYTFAGDSLTLTNPGPAGAGNGSFLEKNANAVGASRPLTINNLTNASGALPIRSGAFNGSIVHIAGNHFTIAGTSQLWADQNIWIIDSPLLGGDSVILTNRVSSVSPANHIAFSGNNSGFTGGWLITCTASNASGYVELLSANSMPGNPSTFNPAQINIGPNGILLDTAGNTFNNVNGGFTLSGSAVINSPATTTIAETITGGFSLTKTGAGVLILSNTTNSYTGGTIISAGTLEVGAAGAIPTNNVTDNGSLDLNAISTTIDGLSGAGTVDTVAGGTPTLTVGINGGGGTLSGVIQNSSGTLSLTKVGAGTEILSGGYTYSGTTTVAGGTLGLSSGFGVPSTPGSLVISNGSTLAADVSSGNSLPANNLILQDNATINVSYGTLTINPTAPVINASGSLSAPGTNIVINIAATGLQVGTITLVKYTGTTPGSLANFQLSPPPGVAAILVNNTGNHSIDIQITSIPNLLSWNGRERHQLGPHNRQLVEYRCGRHHRVPPIYQRQRYRR